MTKWRSGSLLIFYRPDTQLKCFRSVRARDLVQRSSFVPEIFMHPSGRHRPAGDVLENDVRTVKTLAAASRVLGVKGTTLHASATSARTFVAEQPSGMAIQQSPVAAPQQALHPSWIRAPSVISTTCPTLGSISMTQCDHPVNTVSRQSASRRHLPDFRTSQGRLPSTHPAAGLSNSRPTTPSHNLDRDIT